MKRSAILLSIGIVLLLWWIFYMLFGLTLPVRSSSSTQVSSTSSLSLLPLRQNVPKAQRTERDAASTPGPPPIAPIYWQAKEWLNEYSPPLTTEEEDDLLSAHGRTPTVLAALALLNSERSASFLTEALTGDPADPSVLAAALQFSDQLGVDRIELLEKLKTVAPDDGYADLVLATEHWKLGDIEATYRSLKRVYNKEVIGDFADLASIQMELLTEADRSPDSARARVLAASRSLADPGPLYANVLELSMNSNPTKSEVGLAALLIDVSSRLNMLDTVPAWQRIFYFDQAQTLIKRFSDNVHFKIYFDEHPSAYQRELAVERGKLEPIGDLSKALIPLLQQMPTPQRTDFLRIALDESSTSALHWLRSVNPDIFNTVAVEASAALRWPTASFWQSPQGLPPDNERNGQY